MKGSGKNDRNRVERLKSPPPVEEELPLQIKAWKVQRVGWWILILLIVLIALGLFGDGPLSQVRAEKNGMSMEFERFARQQSEMETLLRPGTGQVRIAIPVEYLASFKLDKVFPESYESEFGRDSVYYTFEAGESDRLVIRFYLQPVKRGRIEGSWLVNGTTFPCSHFIYP